MAKPRLDDPFTPDQLRSLLEYDPKTGVFLWRDRPDIRPSANSGRRGTVAGGRLPKGYIHICINGRQHYAHRLAWVYVHGYWPAVEIDHINEIPDDNRIINLRESTHRENNTRSKARKDNRSGVLGVFKCGNRWQAQIMNEGVKYHLGVYATIKEAKAVRDKAARRLHGQFARTD